MEKGLTTTTALARTALMLCVLLLAACGRPAEPARSIDDVQATGLIAGDKVFVGVFNGRLLCTHTIHMRAGKDGQGTALSTKPCVELDYACDARRIDASEVARLMREAGVTTLDVLANEQLSESLRIALGLEEVGPVPHADKVGPFFRASGGRRYRLVDGS